MTEKEAWLRIGQRCITSPCIVFLCHETEHDRPWPQTPEMRKRLMLFLPEHLEEKHLEENCDPAGFSWWGAHGDNEIRATACCFLAAMCDD